MEKFKMILGIISLPFAFALWFLDRVLTIITPQNDHPSFSLWLNQKSMISAFVRLVLLATLRLVFYLIFGL